SALYVDENGPIANAPIEWAFCDDRKPLAELGPVSPRCLRRDGEWFEPLGVGAQASGVLPQQTCRNFGPEVPQPKEKEPPGRPVDPDTTGGYYQPLRVAIPSAEGLVLGIGRTRITCGIVGATAEQIADLKQRSHP